MKTTKLYPKHKKLYKLALKRKDFGRDFLLYQLYDFFSLSTLLGRAAFLLCCMLVTMETVPLRQIKEIFQAVSNTEFLKRKCD